MIKEVQSLLDLIGDYDLFLFDQWGVIHDGKKIFPKAEEVFLHLQNLKKQVVIISNSGKKSSDNISRMKKLGAKNTLNVPLITSGDVCRDLLVNKKNYFKNLGDRYFVVATEYPLLSETQYQQVYSLEKSDFLLLCTTTNFDGYDLIDNIFHQAINLKLPLVCSNPDVLGISGEDVHPSTGDLAIKYKKMGGKTHIIGKPGEEIFEFALNKTGIDKIKTLMIGDSLFNDIYGANQFNVDSLLITSGIHKKDFLANKTIEGIIKDIHSDFQNKGNPNYIMELLK
ncbi:HAD-superfamily class IIA hydrolase, TIGR01459 [alpha proteobacterium HIMB59]|nr:HAD-superfamily class IIA hydrolase, TIGR01459 [alpha proteobacterium HIMB59]